MPDAQDGLVDVRVFVQARMSSARFPGKVLAPYRGVPIVRHVLDAARRALPGVEPIVLTSDQASDDPLAAFVDSLGTAVFRGPLDDVLGRFQRCLRAHPCAWVLRLSADSPCLSARLLQAVVQHPHRRDSDVVTTVCPRTWPRGQNAELIRAQVLAGLDGEALTAEDREHVTPFLYRHADRFRIVNVPSGDSSLAERSIAVDTVDDLRRLEALPMPELRRLTEAVI